MLKYKKLITFVLILTFIFAFCHQDTSNFILNRRISSSNSSLIFEKQNSDFSVGIDKISMRFLDRIHYFDNCFSNDINYGHLIIPVEFYHYFSNSLRFVFFSRATFF